MEQKDVELDDVKLLKKPELDLDRRMNMSLQRGTRSKLVKAWIVIIVLVLVAMAGVGFGVFGMVQAHRKEARIAELEATLSDAGVVVSPDGGAGDVVPSATEEVLASVPERLAINCDDTVSWPEWTCNEEEPLYLTGYLGYGSRDWVTVEYNTYTDEIQLQVNWDNIKKWCNDTNSCRDFLTSNEKAGEETFTDLGISGKVIDIYTQNLSSQALGYEVILFLLDDGTVEYISLWSALESGDFKVRGKLKDVTDVVKFVETSQFVPGGGRNFWAQRADGKLYSLRWALQETTGNSW